MKKKLFAIGISIIFLLTTSTSILSESIKDTEKLTIATDNILIVDDEGDGDYNCIQCAINHANPNDIIEVYSGTYNEHVIIDKEVKLIGIPNEFGNGSDTGNPVIDGNNRGDVVVINSNCVDVICFKIINSALEYRMGSGIIVNGDACNISSNIFENNFVGLNVQADNVMVSHNIFYYNVFGVNAGSNRLNTYWDNQLFNTGFSFQSEPNDLRTNVFDNNTVNGKPVYIHIWDNDTTISHNDAGQVLITDCHNVTIENIKISDTTIGIAIGLSSNLTIRNSTLRNIHRGGISLHADNSNVYNNSFVNCSYGCYLEGGDNFYIHHNNFIKCYKHDQPAISWVKKHQTFMESTNVVYDSNYWDDWIGFKLPFMECFPKIIPGFLNYTHKKLNIFPLFNFDWYPAQTPYLFNNDVKTIYVDDDGGAGYKKIQDAINDANNGDTIYVYNGIYCENVVVDKSIKLIGEDKENTKIKARDDGNTIYVTADNTYISNFTLYSNGIGKKCFYNTALKYISNNNVITNINCLETNFGMWFINSNNNTIKNNYIEGYWDGIALDYSENNILRNNSMYGSGILTDQKQDIDKSNTVNDKVICYYCNETGLKVPEDAGQVILIKCNDFIVENLTINCTTLGISVFESDNNTIRNNIIYENTDFGIILNNSDNNIISNNEIFDNAFGIALTAGGLKSYEIYPNCENNTISKNNISKNLLGLMIIKTNHNNIVENNFINNKYKNIENVMSFENKFDKNYWDDWIGLKVPFLEKIPKFIPVLFTYKRVFSNMPLDIRRIPIGFIFDSNPSKKPYDISN